MTNKKSLSRTWHSQYLVMLSARLRRRVRYFLVIGRVSMCSQHRIFSTCSSATTQSLKRMLRCKRECERARGAAETAEQRELMTWTSTAGTHACKMGHCVLDVQRLSRHQNKEWPGYSRLECRSERERAHYSAKTAGKDRKLRLNKRRAQNTHV